MPIVMKITCFHDDRILFEKGSGNVLHSLNILIVARMEVKIGSHVYYIVSMTTTTTNSLLHSSLTVERMEVKLGAHMYYMDSMKTTTTNSLRHFSLFTTQTC